MLSSFIKTNLRHQAVFDVDAFSGLNITIDTPTKSEDTSISTVIFLQPLSISIVPGEGGKAETRSNKTSNIKFSFQKSNEKGSIICNLGSTQFFFVNMKPIPNLSFTTQMSINRANITPTIGTAVMNKWMYFRLQMTLSPQKLITVNQNSFKYFDFNKISTIDSSINLGREDFSFGLQLVKRFLRDGSRYAYSFLIQKEWNNGNTALDLAAVADPIISLCLRYQRQVNPNWKFGVSMAVDKYLQPRTQITCKTELGKSTVHCSLLSTGIVESKFARKITDKCTMITSGILDHTSKSYKLGLGFYFP